MTSTRIAIANRKGGIAKTATVASVGAALAELGQGALLADLDRRACLTVSHSRRVLETISATYGWEAIEPPTPKTIKFAEAPAPGRSILGTNCSSKGAAAYREVAAALLRRREGAF